MNNYTNSKINLCKILKFAQRLILLGAILLSVTNANSTIGLNSSTLFLQQIKNNKITLQIANSNLEGILAAICKKGNVQYAIRDGVHIDNTKYSIDVKNKSIEDTLNELLNNTKYRYTLTNNKILIINAPAKVALGESVTIKGKIVDENGKVIPGATVLVRGSNVGAITDEKGAFSIKSNINSVLEISCVGFKSQIYTITKQNDNQIFRLMQDIVKVDDVVIIGYGERTKKELISSVSTITADELKESTSANVLSLLQGRVAGLEVNQQSGAPGGGGNKVVIRGYTTMGNSDQKSHDGSPLYVIDGIPVSSNISTLSGTDPLAMMDPSTIESVEILKDAASAAIYGSRAANGVILITTKKGKKGQSEFSASATYAMSQLPTSPVQTGGNFERKYADNMLRSYLQGGYDQAGSGVNTIRYNKRYPASYEDAYNKLGAYDKYWNQGAGSDSPMLQDSLNSFYNNSTHWYKEIFRLGKVLDAKVQASGGSEKMQYMIAGGFFNETGIMYSSNFSRYTLMTNLNVQPSKRISVSSQVALAYSDRSTGPGSGMSMSPKLAVEGYTCNPFETSTLLPSDDATKSELFKKLNSTAAKVDDYGLRASLQLKINILKGLDVSSSIGINLSQTNSNVFEPGILDKLYNESKSTGRIIRSIQFQNENLITYKAEFADGHKIDLLGGLSLTQNQKHELSGSGKGNTNDNVHYYSDSSTDIITENGYSRNLLEYFSTLEQSAMISYFGRIAYNYKLRYLTEISIRKDGSSMFGENNKYAIFPSVALGWNIKEENFMSKFWWLDMAKIRGSWGKSGQLFNKPYLAHGVLASNGTIDGRTNTRPWGNLINKDLTWEESDQYDIGIDMSFMNYRINAKMDYYYKYTKGLLTDVFLPGNFYATERQDRNAGEISNKGIELELDIDILRETAVKWKMGFNISRNWNMFIKAYDNLDLNQLIIGRPVYTMSVYIDEGLYQSNSEVPISYTEAGYPAYLSNSSYSKEFYIAGQRKVKDINGDGYISSKDVVYVGSPLPKAYGGWSNNLKWKNLSFDAHFSYSLGRKIIAQYLTSSVSTLKGPYFFNIPDANFWQKPGDVNCLPEVHGFSQLIGGYELIESGIQNVNYIKLKQLTIGYNFPQKLMRKIGLSDLRLYFTAENLFTLTNYKGMDPEIVSITSGVDDLNAYPLSRKFSFGINVKF